MCVRCVVWSVLVRLVIAMFCDSRNFMWSFWRLSGGIG